MDISNEITNQAQILLEKISKLDMRIMTVESMTGGAIINSLTNIPGYSDSIYGSLVVYNLDAKTQLLGEIKDSVYSLNYANQMCMDCFNKYKIDIILSITGNANFIDDKSVFYIGVKYNDIISARKITLDYNTLLLTHNEITRKTVKKIAVLTILEFANQLIN